jgi:hypothetical protein
MHASSQAVQVFDPWLRIARLIPSVTAWEYTANRGCPGDHESGSTTSILAGLKKNHEPRFKSEIGSLGPSVISYSRHQIYQQASLHSQKTMPVRFEADINLL